MSKKDNQQDIKDLCKLDEDKEMFIGAYWCPIPTKRAYEYVAESGINHMIVNTMIGHEKDDQGYYKTPFSLAKKHGINIVMHCMDKGYANIREYKEIFKSHSNFAGILAKDEPEIPDYDFFIKDYKDYKADFSDKPYYVNLFPIYSSKEQMKTERYEDYLNEYKEKVLKSYNVGDRALMCDCYPLLEGPRIHGKWLRNLEMLRTVADETESDLYLYLQSQGFCELWRQPKTVQELTYQMYVAMAYGVKGLLHYPYRTPASSDNKHLACVTYRGRKTYMFNLVKEMNTELKQIDGAYLGFKWKATVKSIGDSVNGIINENFKNCCLLKDDFADLDSVRSSEDTVIGCFENSAGYQGYMVVNFTDPLQGKSDVVTLTLKDTERVLIAFKDERKIVELSNGKLELTVDAGKGAFVILIKNTRR